HGEISARFGRRAPARLTYAGEEVRVSDDTQLTMFVVEGLIRAVVRLAGKGICNPHSVGLRALLRWYSTQASLPPGDAPGWLVRDRRLHVQRAPGLTCLAALSARVASATHDLSPAVN